ncbi:MAG TPA: Rrf2 family transcriptional regulator [Bryobacteraceae bacterium]|nr:Rrf2 family transcriptional regulator [Bryobacteraceae bacterium]
MLSTTSEHALRALTCLARLPEGASMLGRDLSEQAGIPANYLSKIMWTLGIAGIIDATRGNGGGYRLKRGPDDIYLCEIVEPFERGRTKVTCLLTGEKECETENPCTAHEAWRDVRGAYLTFLHTTTLADISHVRRVDENL